MRTRAMWAVICVTFVAAMAVAQKFEVTAFIGGQSNGGIDLSTTLFRRIDVQNGKTRGLSAGYLLGDRYGVEFMWAYNNADTLAQPRGTGSDIRVFTLDTNQYFGNFQYHFAGREKSLRPFLLVGGGATNLSPARQGVTSATRFAFDVGGRREIQLHSAVRTTSTGEMVTRLHHNHRCRLLVRPLLGWVLGRWR